MDWEAQRGAEELNGASREGGAVVLDGTSEDGGVWMLSWVKVRQCGNRMEPAVTKELGS